jgi:hypothetical protein
MNAMAETHSPPEYEALLRADFASFARHSFGVLNPRSPFALGWHFEVIAAKLAAVRAGDIRRLIVQILCVSYAQDLADKFSRDCRPIVPATGTARRFRPVSRRSAKRCRGSRPRPRAAGSPPRSAAC